MRADYRTPIIIVFCLFLIPELAILTLASVLSADTPGWVTMTRYLAEGTAFTAFVLLFARTGKVWGKTVAVSGGAIFALTLAIQGFSYYYVCAFVPPVALQNLENIRLFLDRPKTVLLAAIAISFAWLTYRLLKSLKMSRRPLPMIIAAVAIPASLVAMPAVRPASHPLRPAGIVAPTTPPMLSAAKTLLGISDPNITGNRLNQKKALLDLTGTFPADGDWPLVKERVYAEPLSLVPADEIPNVIIFFVEGLSNRLIEAYSGDFPDLMPELSGFMRENHSIVFDNYYNHSAATFRGLVGQLCSLYPGYYPNVRWPEYQGRFFCLTDLFRAAGYRSTFFDPHDAELDHLHEMVERLGFDEVMSGTAIIERHLTRPVSLIPQGGDALRNESLFDAVLSATADWPSSGQPQFLAVYPFETHAWLDTADDGIKYGDGGNKALNTVRDLDVRFGEFWRRFKESPAYADTVVIFTTDHAHYQSASYMEAMAEHGESDYLPVFTDRIPFVIHDPRNPTATRIDAGSSTSVNFAPTVAHYFGLPNVPNSFVGRSLFEDPIPAGIADIPGSLYVTSDGAIISVTELDRQTRGLVEGYMDRMHDIYMEGRVWPAD